MNNNKPLIFISHASKDANYVNKLKSHLETSFQNQVEVFVSSSPTAIPSGTEWLNHVLDALEEADAIIIIITRNSDNRHWVGFELGYFWKKLDQTKIHFLIQPGVSAPSPLNTMQGKSMTNEEEFNDFISGVANDIDKPCVSVAPDTEYDVKSLVRIAKYEIKRPTQERSFDRLIDLVSNADWAEELIMTEEAEKTIWTCLDDLHVQIQKGVEHRSKFEETWTKGHPDNDTSSHYVNLNVAGVTVTQMVFVHLDGGRYFVPMPELKGYLDERGRPKGAVYYWLKNSIKFQVGKLIGRFYMYSTIEEFANSKDIRIIDMPSDL